MKKSYFKQNQIISLEELEFFNLNLKKEIKGKKVLKSKNDNFYERKNKCFYENEIEIIETEEIELVPNYKILPMSASGYIVSIKIIKLEKLKGVKL